MVSISGKTKAEAVLDLFVSNPGTKYTIADITLEVYNGLPTISSRRQYVYTIVTKLLKEGFIAVADIDPSTRANLYIFKAN